MSFLPFLTYGFLSGNLYLGWAYKVRDRAQPQPCSHSQGCSRMAEREVTTPPPLSPSHQVQPTFSSPLLTPPSGMCSDAKGTIEAKAPSKPDNASLQKFDNQN